MQKFLLNVHLSWGMSTKQFSHSACSLQEYPFSGVIFTPTPCLLNVSLPKLIKNTFSCKMPCLLQWILGQHMREFLSFIFLGPTATLTYLANRFM